MGRSLWGYIGGLGGGEIPQIDWAGKTKYPKAGKRCPKCGTQMIVRNVILECPGCGHSETKPTSRRRMPPFKKTFIERMHESLAEGETYEGPGEVFELEHERSMATERRVLLALYAVVLVLLATIADEMSHGTSGGMLPQAPLSGAVAMGELALAALLLPAVLCNIRWLKAAALAACVVALPIVSWLTVYGIQGVSWLPYPLVVSYSIMGIPHALLLLWAAGLLLRDIRHLHG